MPELSPRTLLMLHRLLAIALLALVPAAGALAQAARVEVMWLGQSAFRITTPGGKVIMSANDNRPERIKSIPFETADGGRRLIVRNITGELQISW